MSAFDSKVLTKKNTSVHLRIWEDVYDSIEDEAKKRSVSLNMLVNQVLATHTRDERELEEVGFVKVTKSTYRFLLDMVPDDKLREWSKSMLKQSRESLLLARSGAITLDAVLDDLRLLSKSGFFSIDKAKRNGKETISLIHDLGPKASVSLSAYTEALFAQIGVSPKITTTNSSVMVEY
jgi:hypothetical protein